MRSQAAIAHQHVRTRVLIRETTILLGVAVALPLLIHLIPSQSVPWGARLLPLFLAPLLGVLLYRLHVGLVPALLAPTLNMMLTGSPAPLIVLVLTFELVLFAMATHGMLTRWPRLWIAGPLGYVAAKVGSSVAIALLPPLAALRPASDFALKSIVTALPGLLILAAVTLLAIQVRNRRQETE